MIYEGLSRGTFRRIYEGLSRGTPAMDQKIQTKLSEDADADNTNAFKGAAPDTDDDEELMKPSNAMKLGYDIKLLIKCNIWIAIRHNKKKSREEAEDLLKAIKIF